MSKKVKEVEKVEMEMEDLDVEGLELEVEEVDPIEAEIAAVDAEKAEKAGKKNKKEKKEKGEGLASTKALAEDEVGVAYIAQLLNIDQRTLRGFLRSKYRDMTTQKSQRYVWKKEDPQIQEIVDAYRAKSSAPRVSKIDKAVNESEAIEAEIASVEEVSLDDINIEDLE